MANRNSFIIRAGRLDDLNDVVNMNKALYQYESDHGFEPTKWANPTVAQDYFRSVLAGTPDKIVLIADTEYGPIGYTTGGYEDNSYDQIKRSADLRHMYVAESMRSKGVGGELLNAFVDWAREADVEMLHVSTFIQNESAIRFYQNQGFKRRSVEFDMPLK